MPATPMSPPGTSPPPARGAIFAAVALLPLLAVLTYLEVVGAIAASLADLHARGHHPTGPLWLGAFALLGIAGPAAAFFAAWHTKTEGRGNWQAIIRAEMAFFLIGLPSAFLLLLV